MNDMRNDQKDIRRENYHQQYQQNIYEMRKTQLQHFYEDMPFERQSPKSHHHYYIFGNKCEDVAMKMAEDRHVYYIKDESKYWDDYKGEDTIVILGLSKLNLHCYPQLVSWLGNYPSKVPGRIWPVTINPRSFIIASYQPIDKTFSDYPELIPLLESRCDIYDSEKIWSKLEANMNYNQNQYQQMEQPMQMNEYQQNQMYDDHYDERRNEFDNYGQPPKRDRSESRERNDDQKERNQEDEIVQNDYRNTDFDLNDDVN